ncbi:hypothetical protein OHB39_32270 [Streptomyces sp. NBC_00047]|uniref:hypothetical protein n=1 Tax=Streptomyces sp. NBC_00047 TaxID=2975627 RepID=UPI002252D395|nr:hypothetical protein [Streptomyces sp. NBC_00047]MCX5612199.1 hypothetical protein [Streptomyces sp. NBC_00047]
MTTEQKTTTRRPRSPKPVPAAEKCDACDGSGETTTTVRVGRKRREIAATQNGLCPTCLGTGTA